MGRVASYGVSTTGRDSTRCLTSFPAHHFRKTTCSCRSQNTETRRPTSCDPVEAWPSSNVLSGQGQVIKSLPTRPRKELRPAKRRGVSVTSGTAARSTNCKFFPASNRECISLKHLRFFESVLHAVRLYQKKVALILPLCPWMVCGDCWASLGITQRFWA